MKVADVRRTSFSQKPLNFIVRVVVSDGWNHLSIRESAREVGQGRRVSTGAETAMHVMRLTSVGSHSEKQWILDSLRILSKPGLVRGWDVRFGFWHIPYHVALTNDNHRELERIMGI
jgi:hypothetical protein